MVRNKGFLVDTHIFIWWMDNNRRLPKELFDLLNDPKNKIFLSVISIWEIIIKKAKKRLNVPKDVDAGIKMSGFNILPVELPHVQRIEQLPNYHKDPFDRMLISQAQVENLTLISSDQKIWKYKVDILKCL